MPRETRLAAVRLSTGGHADGLKDGVPDVRVVVGALRPQQSLMHALQQSKTGTTYVDSSLYPLWDWCDHEQSRRDTDI